MYHDAFRNVVYYKLKYIFLLLFNFMSLLTKCSYFNVRVDALIVRAI
jgi:hypothetical protein